MKKTLIYTAVFSAMMMVSGCGGGDDSSRRNDKENVRLDTSPIKQNKLYGANINGVPSYYIDDGQNQVSYFHENDEWYGAVENKDGKTSFSFSDDLKEFTVVNDKENRILEIKQIDDKTIFQIIKDSRGIVIESIAYFQEGDQFFIAPLNASQIDKNKKIDITQEYKEGVQKVQASSNYSASAKVSNAFNRISDASKATLNTMIASRSLTRTIDHSCAYGVKDNSDFIQFGKEVVGSVILSAMVVGVVAVAGPFIVGAMVTAAGALATAEGAAIVLGIVIGWNAHASDIDFNNAEALKKLGITKEEIDNEWKKFLDEAKKCQAEGSILVNGVCKKEEEPQCLADEILVNGICKKKELVCVQDEILVDGICKKKEPICAQDEILVDGICKKKEPVCAQGEILENGKCVKQPIAMIGFTKISSTGKKLADSANEWDCVLDNETGLMWEHKIHETTDGGGLRDRFHTYSWFEDASGYADPRDHWVKNGYEISDAAKPYGYYCGNTLAKCNTKDYIKAINSQKLCGYSNWRIPSKDELVAIGEKQYKSNFFDAMGSVWSTSVDNGGRVWLVNFDSGRFAQSPKEINNRLNAVRTGNK